MSVRHSDGSTSADGIVDAAVAQGLTAHTEAQAKALLAEYGIAVPEGGVARTEDEAVAIAGTIEGPVVVKAVGSGITHKTEHGLVALDLLGEEAVRTAARSLLAQTDGEDAQLLVERMLLGKRELMLGMKRDPLFGPVILFGVGGIFAEAHKDIALGVTPLHDDDIERMLDGIRASSLLGAFRGMPPVDRAALANAIRALARIADEHPAITEIDINPLIIEGSRPVAADALVILDPSAGHRVPHHAPAFPDLTPLFAPRAVAVIGASMTSSSGAARCAQPPSKGGFPGRTTPQRPRRQRAGAAALRASGPAGCARPLARGACAGTSASSSSAASAPSRRAWVAAGFAEAGEAGAEAEAGLVETAHAAGVTLIGPNCMGLLATHSRLHAVGFLELRPQPGGLSIVSQSGNIGVQLVTRAERRGVGIDKYVSVGNQASTSALDVVEALGDDPETTAVLVYMEGVGDGPGSSTSCGG